MLNDSDKMKFSYIYKKIIYIYLYYKIEGITTQSKLAFENNIGGGQRVAERQHNTHMTSETLMVIFDLLYSLQPHQRGFSAKCGCGCEN